MSDQTAWGPYAWGVVTPDSALYPRAAICPFFWTNIGEPARVAVTAIADREGAKRFDDFSPHAMNFIRRDPVVATRMCSEWRGGKIHLCPVPSFDVRA